MNLIHALTSKRKTKNIMHFFDIEISINFFLEI